MPLASTRLALLSIHASLDEAERLSQGKYNRGEYSPPVAALVAAVRNLTTLVEATVAPSPEATEAVLAWLRSDVDNNDPIGGDNHVAHTIADSIEAGEHLRRDTSRCVDNPTTDPPPGLSVATTMCTPPCPDCPHRIPIPFAEESEESMP